MEEREENGLCRLILCDREKGLTREVSQSRVMLDPNPPPPQQGLVRFRCGSERTKLLVEPGLFSCTYMWMRLLRYHILLRNTNARGYRSSYTRGEKRLLMQAAVFLLNGASNEGSGGSAGSYPIFGSCVSSREIKGGKINEGGGAWIRCGLHILIDSLFLKLETVK